MSLTFSACHESTGQRRSAWPSRGTDLLLQLSASRGHCVLWTCYQTSQVSFSSYFKANFLSFSLNCHIWPVSVLQRWGKCDPEEYSINTEQLFTHYHFYLSIYFNQYAYSLNCSIDPRETCSRSHRPLAVAGRKSMGWPCCFQPAGRLCQALPSLPSPEQNARSTGFSADSWKRWLDFGKLYDSPSSIFPTHIWEEHLSALDTSRSPSQPQGASISSCCLSIPWHRLNSHLCHVHDNFRLRWSQKGSQSIQGGCKPCFSNSLSYELGRAGSNLIEITATMLLLIKRSGLRSYDSVISKVPFHYKAPRYVPNQGSSAVVKSTHFSIRETWFQTLVLPPTS